MTTTPAVTSLINPTPAIGGDYTVNMRVGKWYDKVTGLLAPFGVDGADPTHHYIQSVEWWTPNPWMRSQSIKVLTFPKPGDPQDVLHGSPPFNGVTFICYDSGPDCKIAIVGMPMEVWGGGHLYVVTRARVGRNVRNYSDRRNIVFLPADPLEAEPDHSDQSPYIGHHHVGPAHGHALLEQGLGKAHADDARRKADITKLAARVKRLEDAGAA